MEKVKSTVDKRLQQFCVQQYKFDPKRDSLLINN